ncbi:hypothetical protein [Streptomyces sp. NPDC094437]|uniref:hypothetical protein n=1 Tax=Streptomyces sp. NPDC094437 TaxID=3366060 RepID=UPI00380B1682
MSDSVDVPATRSTSALEPVPVDGCRICEAAVEGRELAHERGLTWTAGELNAIITQHPHRRGVDKALVATDDRSFSAVMRRVRPLVEEANWHVHRRPTE